MLYYAPDRAAYWPLEQPYELFGSQRERDGRNRNAVPRVIAQTAQIGED
jgi:hypothetical protein